MNRNRLIMIGLIATVLAGLLTVVAYRNSVGKMVAAQQAKSRVVVAARDLELGSKIEAGDVTTVELPKSGIPAGAFTEVNQIVGRGVISALAKNEVILNSKVAAPNAGAGLPAMIPTNMRAVSVQVNEVIAVAGFVTPGTKVDVLLTGSPNHNANTDTMTTTVLENVEVLAAGQKIQPNAEGKPEKVPVITLLVSPDDAQKLTLASSEGKIQLALRNPLDRDQKKTIPVRNAALYGAPVPEQAKAVPAATKRTPVAKKPVPPPTEVVAMEIIKGDKREISKF